jgi:hypothetical protein
MADSSSSTSGHFFRSYLLQVLVLFLITLGLRTLVISRSTTAARDSIGFIRYALNLETPPGDHSISAVIRSEPHPPAYPFLVMLVSKVVRELHQDGVSPDSLIHSSQLASLLCVLILIFPLLALARRLFDAVFAFIASLIFLILPVAVEITSDGLSESLFMLTATTALWFAVNALQSGRWLMLVPSGMAAGLAYLTRPEGLVLNLAVVLTISLTWLRSERCLGWISKAILAFTIGWLVLATPYILTIGKLTNKNAGQDLIKTLQGEKVDPTWKSRPVEPTTSQSTHLLLGAWWNDGINKGQSRAIWAAKALFSEWFKAMHYLPGVFAILGVMIFIRTAFNNSAMQLILLSMAIYAALLWMLAYKVGYVSERHTIFLVLLSSLFAGAAIKPVVIASLGYLPRLGSNANPFIALWVILIAAACLPPSFKVMHANREGHCEAGRWLARNAKPEEVVWDPFEWSDFYARRTMYIVPERNYTFYPTYVIFEPNNQNPHSRLPKLPLAVELIKHSEAVYHWPENQSLENAKVVVYLCKPTGREIPIEP